MSEPEMPPSSRTLSRKAAIVGVGESDYGADYKAERAKAPGYEAPTVEALARLAFERALADSGLEREDIDGLSVSFTYGGPDPDTMAELLGLRPSFRIANGNIMAGPLPVVCAAIAAGEADTVAMVYTVASRAIGRQYGGATYAGGEGAPSSYYYFLPWGFSSQAAHWALMARHYFAAYRANEEDLGAVAIQLRKNAILTSNAVMTSPLAIDEYLRSRYIVRPLHLFDLCLVNDGAVCLIVRRTELAKSLPHAPVLVAGWSAAKVTERKMHFMVRERLHPQLAEAGAAALAMAGASLAEVRHFEGYDPASIHLVNQLEGYGFVEPGAGLAAFAAGEMAPTGRIPTNTAGGNISGTYMHGWAQIVEIVRQLRHEAGPRQIADLEVSMSSLAQTDAAHPIVFVRGA